MLTVKAKMTLALEAQRWKYAGEKERAIREVFDETAVRFHQRLDVILDDPAALAYDAQLVNRLRRLRDARRAQRSRSARGFSAAD